jgi:hypothetical protein
MPSHTCQSPLARGGALITNRRINIAGTLLLAEARTVLALPALFISPAQLAQAVCAVVDKLYFKHCSYISPLVHL